jgi:hypothetical protein
MRFSITLIIILLGACDPKSNTETSSADSTSVVAPDTTVAPQLKDTAVTEKPTEIVPVLDVQPKKKEVAANSLKCKFKSFEAGDCARYVFDCASFGIEAISLPKDQADIWNNLMAFDGSHGDAPSANTQYVGKTFEIVQTVMDRDVCQDGNNVKQKAATVTSFKVAK